MSDSSSSSLNAASRGRIMSWKVAGRMAGWTSSSWYLAHNRIAARCAGACGRRPGRRDILEVFVDDRRFVDGRRPVPQDGDESRGIDGQVVGSQVLEPGQLHDPALVAQGFLGQAHAYLHRLERVPVVI